MFERPGGGERALIVHLDLQRESHPEALQEFRELADSAGADVVQTITGSRLQPDPKFFVGSGKADEIRLSAESREADLVLVNHPLSPAQERNLERHIGRRVLDRTGLILDIFAQRARTHEGKLQVELAQLTHLTTRLVRGWTHLERQKGGIGLRGPGETQLETDRRLIGGRIKQLNRRLAKVREQRQQSRRGRRRAEQPTIALVGYTNAGKSTLFNRLTDEHIYAADQLFATLDPTLRRLPLPGGGQLVVADTVGFIRDLPHDLVESFRSTLVETREADLLLHVIDISDEHYRDKIDEVNSVLAEIGAAEVPQLLVCNKLDRVEGMVPNVLAGEGGAPDRLYLSAATGAGLELLLQQLVDRFQCWQEMVINLPAEAGRLRARLFQVAEVLEEQFDEAGGCRMRLRIDPDTLLQLQKGEPDAWTLVTVNPLPPPVAEDEGLLPAQG